MSGVVSARLSNTLMRPLFSATKTRPSGAKRTTVGWVKPLKATVSWKTPGPDASLSVMVTLAVSGVPDRVIGVAGDREHDRFAAFDRGIIDRRDGDRAGRRAGRDRDAAGEVGVVAAVAGAAADGIGDRQRGAGAAAARHGERAGIAACFGRRGIRGVDGDGRQRRCVVVRDGHARRVRRADRVVGAAGDREHDRLVAFDRGIIDRRDRDRAGRRAGRDRDAAGERGVVAAVAGAAADGIGDRRARRWCCRCATR